MANSVRTDVDFEEVAAKLAALGSSDAAQNALQAAGRKLKTLIDIGFRDGVSPEGAPWRALSMRSGQPLVDTAVLRSSITYKTGNDESGAFLEVGTNKNYARVHQFGAVIKPRSGQFLRFMGRNGYVFAKSVTIPARPFLPLDENEVRLPADWSRSVVGAINSYMTRAVQR